MTDFKEDWERIILPIIGMLILFVGTMWSRMRTWFFRLLGREKCNPPCLHMDIVDIKKTTMQIANEWFEMMKLLKDVQENQSCFVNRLQSHMEAKSETLNTNITISLEEEFLRSDQRFVRMKRTIEAIQEEIISMKGILQTFAQKSFLVSSENSGEENKSKQATFVDSFVQTDNEIKKRNKDTHTKNGASSVSDSTKFITTVKQCLTDLIKDTKLHLSIDREEENRELQVILTKLSEDREDIKKTIIQAFSIAADQAKKNSAQFGHIGEDAMHYIAVLNENTNKMLKLKLEETDDRLKEILSAVNRQIFDVDAIRETLENIDVQFDFIFQRVELGCQRNTEHCEEMAESLEKTSNKWVSTVSELDNVAKDLSNGTETMKGVLKEMAKLIEFIKQADKQENNNEIVSCDSNAGDTAQDLRVLSQKQRNMMFIYSMIQSCWENMTCMNSRVENGCETICKLIEGLEYKLRSLNESAGRLDKIIRNVQLDGLEDWAASSNCYDAETKEVIEDMAKSIIGNARDGPPEVFQNISSKLTNANQTTKMQNEMEIVKEMKMVEHILRKVCEKRNISFRKREIPCTTRQESVSDMNEDSSSGFSISSRYDNLGELEQNNGQESFKDDEL